MMACPTPLPADEIVEKYRFYGYKFLIFFVETIFCSIWSLFNEDSSEDSTEDLSEDSTEDFSEGAMKILKIGINFGVVALQFAVPMSKRTITY